MAIFEHEDNAGDAFKIVSSLRAGELALYWAEDNTSYVNLPRNRVRDLRDALNRWLDEQQSRDPNPAGRRPEPVTPDPYEAIVKRLTEEWLPKVLPLYQSPQAAVPVCPAPLLAGQILADVHKECGYVWAMHKRAEPQHASNTGLVICEDLVCPQRGNHAEHDPEPQAVGHPEAPGIDWTDKSGVRYEYCGGCGHSWTRHGVGAGNCNVKVAPGDGNRHRECGCEAIRADQRPPVAPDSSRYDQEGEPVKAECTCRRHEHRPGATRRCAYPGCFCRRQS